MAMSKQHKEALARGRRESAAIKKYLTALGSRRPGRPVTPESLKKRLEGVSAKLAGESDPLKRLELTQQRIDIEESLKAASAKDDMQGLEKDFVKVAKDYSQRKGISYSAWREQGVPAEVLKRAGVPRTRRV